MTLFDSEEILEFHPPKWYFINSMKADTIFRLITRSDFDGLVCAVLFKELGIVDEIRFVHPKDVQDGKIEVGAKDITANLPFSEGVGLAFDHHESEMLRTGAHANFIIDPSAHSAARVVYDYYGGASSFPRTFLPLIAAADKIDSANYDLSDVLHPAGWTLLGFITDSRTGLGRFKEFRISNYQLMLDLVGLCRTKRMEEILDLPDVKERIDFYNAAAVSYREQLERLARLDGNVLVVDYRGEETIHVGNRFLRYALYPSTNISLQAMWGLNRTNTVISLGKSIFNRSSRADVGKIMLSYGGGGHENAGTCQVSNDEADDVIGKILSLVRESP